MELREKILVAFESLENQRVQLEDKLDAIDPALLAIPEAEGKWSVNQVLAHLSNSEYGTLGYINKKMKAIDRLGKSNLGAGFRYRLLKWLLDSPIKYQMPKVLTQPSDQLTYEALKLQFKKNRYALRSLIEQFPAEVLDRLIFRHPFAGRFTLLQTICFLEDHYNHHLRQIDRVLKGVVNRGT